MEDEKLSEVRMDGPMSYDHFSEITAEYAAEAKRNLRLHKKNSRKAIKELLDAQNTKLVYSDSNEDTLQSSKAKLYHKSAVKTFNNLDGTQIRKLKKIARHACVFSANTSYIDNAILPTMYDYQLFTGSDYLLDDLKMLEKDTDIRIKRLDIEDTLLLITSALAGGNPGAEYWYRRRITGKLFKHLIDLSKK